MKRIPVIMSTIGVALLLVACSSTLSSSSPTPPYVEPATPDDGGSTGMPEIIASDECRDQTGILPIEATDRSPNAASFALRYVLLTQSSQDIAFVDVQEGRVVVYGSESATVGTEDIVTRAMEQLAASGHATDTEWTIAESLPWNFDDLCAAFDVATTELGSPGGVQGVGFSTDGRLEVGITAGDPHPETISALERDYPEMIVWIEETGTDLGASHRSNDTDGFSAGMAIQTYAAGNEWWSCTAGFAIQNGYGTFLLTAGHCSSANTQTVRNGTSQCWAGLPGNAFAGLSASRFLSTTGDFAVIQNSPGIGGRMWVGPRCVGSGEVSVLGAVTSTGGAAVGLSGNNTGQATGTVISSSTICRDIAYSGPVYGTVEVCGLYSAEPTPSSPIAQPGDSGGPVFGYTTSSAVYGAGTIVSVNNLTGVVRYMSLPRVLSVYAASLVLG